MPLFLSVLLLDSPLSSVLPLSLFPLDFLRSLAVFELLRDSLYDFALYRHRFLKRTRAKRRKSSDESKEKIERNDSGTIFAR